MSKKGRPAKDYTGKKFGKLTVIKRTDDKEKERKHKSAIWICKCECGNVIEVQSSRLKNIKSCGCYSGVFNDLTGLKFGRLIVIKRGKTSKNSKKIYWICKCDCGEIKEVQGNALTSGETKSCGCLRREITSERFINDDIVGKKFNRLLVLDFAYRKNGLVYWECLCDCGNFTYSTSHRITSGEVKSCGCYNIEALKSRSKENHPSWKGGTTKLHTYLRSNIKQWKEDSIKICDYKCIITGKEFDVIHHIYPFHKILDEIIKRYKIPIKDSINDYTNTELEILKNVCLNLHYKYYLGVCLTKEIHDEFHKKYGYTDFTPEDFQEFYFLKTGKHLNLDKFKVGEFTHAV